MNELADRIMDEGIAKGADPVIGIQMGMLADT
jgi:hypothetical protein